MSAAERRRKTGFDADSFDAQFATIIQQLKQQDAERWDYQKLEGEYRTGVQTKLDRIEIAVNKTNGRVTALENENWRQRGFVAAIALAIGAAWHYLTK